MRMHLIRLELKNIASYGNSDNELDFSSFRYPILVTGSNGSGKTTFFVDGVTFALFKSAYGRGPTGSGSSTRLILPAGKKTAGKIELMFEVGGEVYIVIRRGSWTGDSVRWESILYKMGDDGQPKRMAIQEEVDKKIRQLTGFDYKMFLDSVVIRQGDVFSFVDKVDSERRDLLLRLISLELDKYRVMIREKLNLLNNKISRLKGAIEADNKILKYNSLTEIDKDKGKLLDIKEKLEDKISVLGSKIHEFRREKEKVDRELGGFIRVNHRIEEIKERLNDLNNKVKKKGLHISLEKMENIDKLYADIKELTEVLKSIEKEIERYKEILNKFSEMDNLTNVSKELEIKKKKLLEEASSKGVELSDEYISSLKVKVQFLNNKLSEIIESIDLLKSSKEPNCPLCGRPLDKVHRTEVLSKLLEERGNIEFSLKKIMKILKYVSTIYKIYSEIEEDIKEYRMKINFYMDELRGFDKKSVETAINKLDDKKKNIILQVSGYLEEFCKVFVSSCNINSYEILYNLYVSERPLLNEIRMFFSELENLHRSFDKEKYIRLSQRAAELNKAIEDTVSEKDGYSKDLESLRNELTEVEKQRDLMREIIKLKNQLDKLNEEYRLWAYLLQYVFADSRFPRSLLKDIVENFLTPEANRFLSVIFPSAVIRLSVSEEGRGVSLNIYINNIRREKSTLSGGEKTLIGFSIRLAISSLASTLAGGIRPDFVIIDEGFGPLDELNKDLIAETLGMLVKNELIKQVIVITHESELKNHPVFREIVNVMKINEFSHIKY